MSETTTTAVFEESNESPADVYHRLLHNAHDAAIHYNDEERHAGKSEDEKEREFKVVVNQLRDWCLAQFEAELSTANVRLAEETAVSRYKYRMMVGTSEEFTALANRQLRKVHQINRRQKVARISKAVAAGLPKTIIEETEELEATEHTATMAELSRKLEGALGSDNSDDQRFDLTLAEARAEMMKLYPTAIDFFSAKSEDKKQATVRDGITVNRLGRMVGVPSPLINRRKEQELAEVIYGSEDAVVKERRKELELEDTLGTDPEKWREEIRKQFTLEKWVEAKRSQVCIATKKLSAIATIFGISGSPVTDQGKFVQLTQKIFGEDVTAARISELIPSSPSSPKIATPYKKALPREEWKAKLVETAPPGLLKQAQQELEEIQKAAHLLGPEFKIDSKLTLVQRDIILIGIITKKLAEEKLNTCMEEESH